MWNLKGIEINDLYKVDHFIEKTDFCEIYTGSDIKSSKVINLSIYKDSEIADDDLDEDGNLKEIQFLEIGIDAFPKLVTFGDFNNNSDKFRYIATEHIAGESVAERIKRNGPLDEYDTLKIALKLCEVGEKLHNRSKPVLINGLSLDNIMIDMSEDDEKIRFRNLINMRLLNDNFKYTYLDGLNINHIAPELLNNTFSPKSDQYNIGALTYEMHTGMLPYFNDDSLDIKDSVNERELKEFRNVDFKLSDEIGLDLRSVLEKTLSSDPNDRYDSLSELSSYLNKERIVIGDEENIIKKNEPVIKRGNGFADVAGMEDLKNELETKIIDIIKRPEHWKKYGTTIPNGALLYGPPGCGKTFIAKKFCEEAGLNFKLIKPSDVSSSYVRGGVEKIRKLFDEAEINAPSIICFDEADAIMPKRKGTPQSQHADAEVNEYLTQIDKCSERGIFVIVLSNIPHVIDVAIVRSGRCDIHVYVPEPDKIARKSLFELFLKNRYTESNLDIDKLSSLTENYTASDIELIVNNASHTSGLMEVKISTEILIETIGKQRSSLTPKQLKEYQDFRKEFEGDKKDNNSSRNMIGFNRN